MRKCIDCLVEKDINDFPLAGVGTARKTRCKDCYRVYDRNQRRSNYDSARNQQITLLKKYNLTIEQYEQLVEKQSGLCAICVMAETRTRDGRISALAVDHDHACCPGARSCGECVRGLLCYRCNSMLGFARDNIKTLKTAAQYLEYNED